MGDVHPPIWGKSVLEQYAANAGEEGGTRIPSYIMDNVHSNERTYMTEDQVK